MAERAGFEPAVRFPLRQFSKLLLSATQPSLRKLRILNVTPLLNNSNKKTEKFAFFLIFYLSLAICSRNMQGFCGFSQTRADGFRFQIGNIWIAGMFKQEIIMRFYLKLNKAKKMASPSGFEPELPG